MDGLRGTTYWDVVGLISLFLIVPIGLLITAYAALVRARDERRAFRPPDLSQPWHAPDESRAPAMRRDDIYGAQATWTDQEPHPTTADASGADALDRRTPRVTGTMAANGRRRWGHALIGAATMAAGLAILSLLYGMGSSTGAAAGLVVAAVVIGWVFTRT